MHRLASLCTILALAAAPAFSQSFPEIDALREAFLAKNVETVLAHLPSSLNEALSQLPAPDRVEIEQQFLIAERLKREGVQITLPDGGAVLAVVEPKQGEAAEAKQIVLDKRISDGYESVLWLSVRDQQEEGSRQALQISLRFEDGAWRVYELRLAGSGEAIDLDGAKFIEKLHPSRVGANEASAIGTLRTYNTANVTYAATYPDIGYPPNLNVLGTEGTEETTSDHSGLVDTTLSSPPYEKAGYRFTYERTGALNYTIVGRPLEYGVSGRRAFFTDQTGVVRFTEEDRLPTGNDPPLQ
jgi:hypothetical protein